jgi:hypothetical protein
VTANPNAWVSWSKFRPGGPALRDRAAALRVHRDRLHRREVDNHAAVDGREAGDAVRATAYRERQALLRANSMALITSAAPVHRMIRAGCLSCAAFQTARASS